VALVIFWLLMIPSLIAIILVLFSGMTSK